MQEPTIHTEHTPLGWCATFDGYEPPDPDGVGGGLVGRGATEDEARTDLLEQNESDACDICGGLDAVEDLLTQDSRDYARASRACATCRERIGRAVSR